MDQSEYSRSRTDAVLAFPKKAISGGKFGVAELETETSKWEKGENGTASSMFPPECGVGESKISNGTPPFGVGTTSGEIMEGMDAIHAAKKRCWKDQWIGKANH